VFDPLGQRIALLGDGPGTPALVDHRCRVLDAAGSPVPGLLGIGLASGFVVGGPLGGEPGFRGQTNGLWLYQNGIGERVLAEIGCGGPDGSA
jgi:predicted oxidoreductase